MDTPFQLILIVVVAILAIVLMAWNFSRSRSMLKQWADENGFEIIHSEYRNFAQGPFSWTTSRSQTVYFLRVRDRRGTERSGWIRLGGWVLGLMSDKVEVKWEDEL